ncbi:MAG: hypothetical protein LIP03_12620 [Bacteroidales bacterium]|nr:hypothetical protein [Bacteroidales bacterium]
MDNPDKRHAPWWMTVLILVLMSPVLAFPSMISSAGTPVPDALLWLYPAYVLASGICAWMCFPQRPAITWIILALLLLSNAGMLWLLTFDF